MTQNKTNKSVKKDARQESKNKPLKKVRVGRFQISLWQFKRLLTSGDPESIIYTEQWTDVAKVCVQYSTFNKGTNHWENQKIWCAPDDLRDFQEAIDQLSEGETPSSPSQKKVTEVDSCLTYPVG